MPARSLRIGCSRYEHTAALLDGQVAIDGVGATYDSPDLVSDIFEAMTGGEYDIAEYGLTYFLRSFDTPVSPFLALPIFPARNFRHSAIYVNSDSGIDQPEDLNGRTVGEFALYGHDSGVWPKGILADEHGFKPESCRWVIGGTNFPIPSFDWIPQPVPPGVEVRHTTGDQTLGAMLESGEIDALISVDVPRALLAGSSKVRRLFPDYVSVERDYYRRTGIFPIMHVVAIRRELAAEPGLARAVHDAFVAAREITQERFRRGAFKQHMSLVTPWFSDLYAANRTLLGEDWWPYGVERNRAATDTFLRYHYEQGLSRRLLTSDDIFAPELMST